METALSSKDIERADLIFNQAFQIVESSDQKEQQGYLIYLGGRISLARKDYPRASKFFNASHAFYKKHCPDKRQWMLNVLQQMFEVETDFLTQELKWDPSHVEKTYTNNILAHRARLSQARQSIIRSLDDNIRTQDIETEYTKQLNQLIDKMIGDCKKCLGEPPHDASLAVATLGSLGRGEPAPYSDCEYIFITSCNCSECLQYAENLAQIFSIKMTNLSICGTKK